MFSAPKNKVTCTLEYNYTAMHKNYILTGCIVPPARTTALASFTISVK